MTESAVVQDGLFAEPVGEKLKAARLAAKLDLAEIATRTRIPQRHLEAIERGDFAALPGLTYAIGFSRAVARTLGLDEVAIAAQLRGELGQEHGRHPAASYEPADPARVPPRLLAWTAAAVAVLIVGGYMLWRFNQAPDVAPTVAEAPASLAPADENASTAAAQPAAPPAPATPAADAPVVLTANDTVWISIKDRSGKKLYEKEMQPGESFAIPPGADAPTLLTGRPQALAVTVGGTAIPPLGPADRTIKDVVLTPTALAARAAVPPAAAPQEPVAAPR